MLRPTDLNRKYWCQWLGSSGWKVCSRPYNPRALCHCQNIRMNLESQTEQVFDSALVSTRENVSVAQSASERHKGSKAVVLVAEICSLLHSDFAFFEIGLWNTGLDLYGTRVGTPHFYTWSIQTHNTNTQVFNANVCTLTIQGLTFCLQGHPRYHPGSADGDLWRWWLSQRSHGDSLWGARQKSSHQYVKTAHKVKGKVRKPLCAPQNWCWCSWPVGLNMLLKESMPPISASKWRHFWACQNTLHRCHACDSCRMSGCQQTIWFGERQGALAILLESTNCIQLLSCNLLSKLWNATASGCAWRRLLDAFVMQRQSVLVLTPGTRIRNCTATLGPRAWIPQLQAFSSEATQQLVRNGKNIWLFYFSLSLSELFKPNPIMLWVYAPCINFSLRHSVLEIQVERSLWTFVNLYIYIFSLPNARYTPLHAHDWTGAWHLLRCIKSATCITSRNLVEWSSDNYSTDGYNTKYLSTKAYHSVLTIQTTLKIIKSIKVL